MKLPSPSESDMREAYVMTHCGGWDRFKARARDVQLRRLLDENMKLQRELCSKAPELSAAGDHLAWRENSDAIDRAFKRHDELMALAYPEVRDE